MGSDGANCNTHDGRDCRSDDAAHDDGKCRPDDANSYSYSSLGDASEAVNNADDGKLNDCSGQPGDSNARDRWVWNPIDALLMMCVSSLLLLWPEILLLREF